MEKYSFYTISCSVMEKYFILLLLITHVSMGLYSDMESRLLPVSFSGRCRRLLPGIATPVTPGNNGFQIRISGNPDKYQPGESYTVTLTGVRSQQDIQKFIGFMLMVEPKESTNDISSRPNVGSFQLTGDGLSKFSEECPNAIVHTSTIEKSEVKVLWKAPPAKTGCVVFKSTVQETKDIWYMDDGSLMKELCEDDQGNWNEQPEILEKCCACDEAKYELTFEGIWSRHTHPKDFPQNEWKTRFSDIIGASHSGDFRLFVYGEKASEGIRETAMTGDPRKLESELKTESNKIRTIIKARGLQHPNLTGKTFAAFRVDNTHHLMSFLTTLIPSPDWIVGVSALELCLPNCSWVTEKIMNLYLWDAGVAGGVKYEGDTVPSIPQEKIHRITSSNPNTEASPFYDPSGNQMKPVARLIVTRQRVYEKECKDNYMSTTPFYPVYGDGTKPECRVSEWTEWTPCSMSCGRGIQIRSRHYYNQLEAEMLDCEKPLVEQRQCDAVCVGNVSCSTTEWSDWSYCSVTCGKGVRTRTRRYLDMRSRSACALKLMEKETCFAPKPYCDLERNMDPLCAVTQWTEWSPCSTRCGKGVKMRTRAFMNPAAYKMCSVILAQNTTCEVETPECTKNIEDAKKICLLPMDTGPCRGYSPRWYYDAKVKGCLQFIYGGCKGNRNMFQTYKECHKNCEMLLRNEHSAGPMVSSPVREPPPMLISGGGGGGGNGGGGGGGMVLPPFMNQSPPTIIRNLPMDCMVSDWSEYTPCSQTCGKGRKERRRTIIRPPENGGKPCPAKLVQRRKCKNNPPCPNGVEDDDGIDTSGEDECIMNNWSEWTPCSKTCGKTGTKQRTKTVKQLPEDPKAALQCIPKTERKYCVFPPCPVY